MSLQPGDVISTGTPARESVSATSRRYICGSVRPDEARHRRFRDPDAAGHRGCGRPARRGRERRAGLRGPRLWRYGALSVQRLGAMLGPLTFLIDGDRQVSPLYLAPWAASDARPPLSDMLKSLRGEWPCVPFGSWRAAGGFTPAYKGRTHRQRTGRALPTRLQLARHVDIEPCHAVGSRARLSLPRR